MEDVALYLSFFITFSLCFYAAVFLRNMHKSGGISCQKVKSIYSFVAFIFGLLGGTFIFHGLTWLFKLFGYSITYGHGEILFASIFFNVLLSIVFIGVGRVVIGWQNVMW